MSIGTTVRERPILFSAPMVRAILAGEKTQTRRMMVGRGTHKGSTFADVKQWSRIEADGTWIGWCEGFSTQEKADEATQRFYKGGGVRCPYGFAGDRLWVRETWGFAAAAANISLPVLYRADEVVASSWKSPIFMPRWASRITLEITDVRVERLQDISEADAVAEGCVAGFEYGGGPINEIDIEMERGTEVGEVMKRSVVGLNRLRSSTTSCCGTRSTQSARRGRASRGYGL